MSTPEAMPEPEGALIARAAIARERAEWEAAETAGHRWDRPSAPGDNRVAGDGTRMHSRRRLVGATVVFSVRLEPRQVRALERRAAAYGIGPTALARNLIRIGLDAPGRSAAVAKLAELEAVVAELRDLVQ